MNMMTEIQQQAEKLFQTLDTPILKYGQGVSVSWKDIDFTASIEELKKQDNPITITADSSVKIILLLQMDADFVEKYSQKLVSYDENKVTALHYAAVADATVVIIPQGCVVKNPIEITTIGKNKANAGSIIIVAEPFSKAVIIEKVQSVEDCAFLSSITQVFVQEHAEIQFYSLQNPAVKTRSFSTKRGEVHNDASLTWIDLVEGSVLTQHQVRSLLAAPGAVAAAYSLFMGMEKQLFDFNTEMIHQTPHTKSVMKARGILQDAAKAVHRGLITIGKDAAHCVGTQKIDVLKLGETARCDAIPVLDVNNDEVVCSHGAAITTVDDEQLFYLLSRGITEPEAVDMLKKGFLQLLVKECPSETMQEYLGKTIERKLGK